MARTTALLLSLLAGQTCTFRGIRIPAYNGPFGRGGYNNSPVKDLASIDMRCNVLGDLQAHDTIKVNPGDNLTLDWHHETRSDADDVIASSHHGPSMVYISSDPPTNDSFVKIWHEGKYQANPFPQPGLWSTTGDVAKRAGHMNVRVPAGLKAGFYLIRAEMVGLHEADSQTIVGTSKYTASWSKAYATPPATAARW
ncbi:Glycoside hydrolase family 61 protein [Pyrenophora tritici-repentis]|nr:Glycoside hydrolase family 61 protein [Pyrenophora tritici-repentis]